MHLAVLLLYQLSYYRIAPTGRDRTGDLDVNSEVTLIYDTFFIFNFF